LIKHQSKEGDFLQKIGLTKVMLFLLQNHLVSGIKILKKMSKKRLRLILDWIFWIRLDYLMSIILDMKMKEKYLKLNYIQIMHKIFIKKLNYKKKAHKNHGKNRIKQSLRILNWIFKQSTIFLNKITCQLINQNKGDSLTLVNQIKKNSQINYQLQKFNLRTIKT